MHPDEFLWLGLRLLQVNDVWQAYELLAKKSSRGKVYYDETVGLQHQRAYEVLGEVLSLYERQQVEVGLDVGTGTGEVALRLAKHCNHVMALDVMPSLLAVAGEKLECARANFSLIEGDAMELDALISPNSVDVVTMNAVEIYLSPEELPLFYQKLHTVLKPGGRVYNYSNPDFALFLGALFAVDSQRVSLAYTIAARITELSFRNAHKGRPPMLPEDYGFLATRINIPNGTPLSEQVFRLQKV